MKNIENPMLDSAKKKKKILKIIISTCCVLYVIFAARPLSREIHFVPVWTIDADKSTRTDRIFDNLNTSNAVSEESQEIKKDNNKNTISKESLNSAIPFKMGQLAGYFTKHGKMLSRVTFPYKASISSSFYTLYETNSDSVIIHSPSGEVISEIKQAGFPYFSDTTENNENKIYLMLPGGAAFAKVGMDGSVKWLYEGHATITSFSTSESGILVGFADGILIAFDFEGKILFKFTPAGSKYPVILGSSISNSGKLIATVSGQDKQRFVLAKNKDGNLHIIFHKYLEKEVSEQMIVRFRKDESAVYYSCAGGLGVLNCKTYKDSLIRISGKILSIQEDEDGNMFVLSKDDGVYSVSVIEPFDIHSGSFSFEADTAFVAVKSGSLFVGHDSQISRIDIQHK